MITGGGLGFGKRVAGGPNECSDRKEYKMRDERHRQLFCSEERKEKMCERCWKICSFPISWSP
jgi:hypothetical protein